MEERRKQLYNNLINSGKTYVNESLIGTEDQFMSAISSPEKAGEFYDNLRKYEIFSVKEIGTRDQFINSIAPDFGNTGNTKKQDNIFSEDYIEKFSEPSPSYDVLSKMANPLETPFTQYIDETLAGKQNFDSWQRVKKSGEEYLRQKESERLYRQNIDNETKRIQDEIKKGLELPEVRVAAESKNPYAVAAAFSQNYEKSYEKYRNQDLDAYRNYKAANSLIEETKKKANASKNKSGFWKGVGDNLLTKESVTLGLSTLSNTKQLKDLLDKVEKQGIKSLTPSENTLLEAASVKSLSDMIYESGLSTLYNVGSATGTSIPYMLQFVITRAPASAIAKPVMKKLTGYVTKRFGEAAIKKAAARAISTLPKVGTKTALKTANALTKTGVAALEAGATGALMPIIQPSMYNDILERRMGQVDADINPQTGKVQYKGQTGEKSWGKSIGEGFTAGAIENLAEMSGGAIMKTLGVPVKALSKVSPKSREFINIISEKPLLRSFNRVREDIAKTTGVHSIPGEALEEFVGQTANALTVGDQKLEDIYTWENAWMTLASVAPLSIGMGSASGVMAQATKKKVVRDYNRASQKLSEAYSPDLVEYIKSRVGGSPEQQAMIIRQYYDRAREAKNEEEKRNIANEYRLVMDYAAAVNNYDAYIGGIEARVANEVSALSEQIRNDINPDMNATVYIDYDGQMARVTSGNIVFDENGDINDSKSDDTITIELQDGTKQMVSPDKFKVTGYRSFYDQINEATQNIENTILSQEDTDVYGPDPVLDEALYINTDNGPVSVKVTRADYGGFEGIQIDESGKEITEIINGIETPVSIPFSKDQIIRPDNPTIETENNTVAEDVRPLQAGDVINVTGFQNPVTFVSESNGDAIVGLLDNMGNPIINTEGKQVQVPVKSEQIIHSQTQSQEIKEETSDSASPVEEEVIPMRKNKKGEQVKDYVSMPDNMFVEHMINDYGNEAAKEGLKDRKRNIDSLINRLKKRRDKSTNTNEKIDIDDEINDLKSRLQILEELSQNLPNEPNSFKERLNSLSEPVSLEDYILQGIASGEYKFKWGGKNGLSDELGLKSDRERRSRIGILKNDGYTPETLAERIFQEIEYGQLPFSVEELEIRNSIIDILNRVHSRKRALEESESLQKEFEDQQIRVQEQNSDVVEELTPEELQEIDEAIAELKPIDDIRFRTNMSSSSENLNNETLNNGNKNTALFNIESINDFAGMTPEQKIVFNAVIDMLKDANIPVEVLTNNQINSLVEFQNSRLMTVYHGSGAKFDAFDHSHIGEGEGAQAYGWGSYVTEVEGIGRTYAESNSGNIFKSGFGDFYLQEIRKGLAEGNQFEDIKQKLLSYHADMYEKAGGNIEMYGDFISDYETLQQLKENDLPKRNLYTVEIPDNTGNNYLVWNEEVNETQKEEIISSLSEIYDEDFDFDYFLDKMDQYEYEYNLTGEGLYKLLSKYGFNNNSQKASNILQQIGYTGISYPAQYRTGGRSDGAKNYVIFNENDLKIKDRISFFKDNKGIIYGATINGEIYLNGSALNPETPIHEYTHIWDYACKDNNPELWNRGIKLMKQTTVWEEVKNDPNYSDLQTDDEIASEVHSRLTGKDSTKLMENIVSKASRKSSLEIVKAISLRENLKKWISDFWWWLKDTMSPWTKNKSSKVSLEDFVNMPLKDLVIGTKLNIKINHKSFKTQNKNNLLNNQKENNDITSFAIRHNLIEKDVQDYADYMRQGNLNGASGAFTDIRRKVRIDNKGVSLGEFTKIFSPIRQELYEKFGNVDELREQYVQTEMEKRDMMDAARKRAEDAAEAERKRLQEFQGMSDEQLDEEYFKAIDTNDESRMRDLVNEAARRNGYGDVGSEYQGVGAWSAPSNPGYESDEERRAAVENESPDVNVTDIANGYLQQPDDYFTNLRAYGNNNPHGRESAEAINNAMDDVRKGKDPKIKVYRAVPKTVKEGTLRNGDWVTPSRKYAEMHGNNRLEGDYRIIEQEVSASQLWWDGNDINEWGFDDGKRYAYRNTRNNRKLNDLITRDDKGNVIPLSKRFNSRKEDTRFRFIGEEGAANLDRSEEATTRLDNLNVAREMENAFEEKKARIEKLRNSEPVEITGNEITPSEDLKQYKKNALEYGKKLQGEYTNKDTGRTIQLQRGRKNGGIKEVLSHDTLNDTAQIKSIAAIPSIIENAIYIDSSENQDTHKNPNVVSYHYYICGLKIGGEDYTVRMVEAEEKDGSRYYDHRLTHIEKGKLINELALINSSSSTELSSTPDAEAEDRNRPTNRGEIQTAPISNIKDTRLISLLQTNNQENARKIKLATGWERGADGKWQHDTEAKLQIPKEEKINEIKRLSDILNTEVEIYDTQADLPTNIREKANGEISGYYMPGNDKVAIVLDANISIGDIQATMLHEIVGHKGIRGLFGNRTDEFLDKVFESMDANVRAEYMERFNSERLAAEEYLSELAEYNPETSGIKKIIAIIRDFFREILGIDLKLSDNDIVYILSKSRERLQNSRNLSENKPLNESYSPNEESNLTNTKISEELKHIQQETEETLYRLKYPVKVDVSGDSAIEAAEKISGAQYLQRVIDKDIYRNISYNTLNRNAIQAVGYGRKKLRYFDKRKMENAYKGLFDNMNDLHNLQKTIIDTYGSIDDSLNAYYAENASSSRAQDRTNRFQVEYEQPLINTLAKIRKKFNNDDFMMKYYPSVRTIIERQKVITDREIKKAQNDPKIKDDRQSLFAAIQLAEKKDYAGQTGTYKEILAHEYPEFKFPANFETMTYDEVKDFAKENNLISMEDFVERSENILGNDLVNEFWNNVRKISQYKLYNDYQTGMISRDMFEELTYGVTMKELAKKRLDAGEIKQEQYDLVLNTFNRPESLLSRGIITKDQYNSLKPRYEYYLPLKGTSDVEADDINEYNNKKVKNISALKAVEGHENVARDPLPQLLQDVYGSIMSQEQNRWRNTLLNMLRKYPMPDLYHIQTEYFTPIRNEKGNIIEYVPYVKIVNDKLIFVPTDEELKAKTAIRKRKGLDLDIEINKRQSSEHTVTFLENGDYVTVYFTDPRIAQSINNLNVNTLPTFLDSIMKWGGKINRFRSQFMTTANPEFVIANVIKDFQEANSNILIKEGLKYWKEFNKIYLNPELGAAIRRRLNGKKGDTEIDKYVDEFFKYGGETAYNMLPGYEQKRKDLYKEIKKVNKEGNKAILVGSKVKDWAKDNLEMLNKQAELRARIATYVTSRKHTKREISRSIWDAKEITVNFDKKGSWAKGFGFWQLFWNAGRQSNRMQIQMIKTHPIKWAIVKSVNTAIGFAETVLPWLILDDDDRKNYLDKYFSITPYLRYSNLIMGFGGELVTIPLPPAFIPSHTLGVCMAEMVLKNNEPGFDPTALVIDVANAGANEWLPEFIVDPVFDIANRKDFVISSIVPAQLKPFAEIYDNRNFFGSPIYNDNINEFKPAYQRIYNGTGPTYVNISQTLNNWTGGNEVDRGFIQLNPAILEHLVEGYVSGLGKFGEKAFTTLSGNAESSKDIPVLGRFWRGDIEYYLDRDEKNTYYRLLKQAEEYRYRRNEYRKLNGYESEKEELKKEGELYEPILIQIRKLNRYKRLEKNTSDPKKKEKYKNKQNEVYKKVQQIEEEYNNKKFNQ